MTNDKTAPQPAGGESGAQQKESAGAPATASDGQPLGRARDRRRELAFALAALMLLLVLVEGFLRLTGFRFVPVPFLTDLTWGPVQLKAMNQSMGRNLFQPDDLLFWSMVPGTRLDTREVNELGLLNGPIALPKPSGAYRILCLGDSCTAMGPAAYPTLLQKRLDILARPDRRFETINAGVFAYTSLQGLRLFRDRLAGVQPDLVTVCYGWNDHYRSQGYPDKMLRSRQTSAGMIRLLRHLRFYRLIQQIVTMARRQSLPEWPLRVSPEDYRENLRAIIDLAGARGARVLLLTAPSNHRPGNVPAFFLENRLAESEEALIARHRDYNKIAREVAAEKTVELLDLEAIFDQRDKDELFLRDGAHENPQGRHLVAQLIMERLGKMGVISAEDQDRIAKAFTVTSTDPNLLRSRIEFLDLPLRGEVGRPFPLAVNATNTGDTIWLARSNAGYGEVQLGVVIYDLQGQRLYERERVSLPHDLRPGETIRLDWTVSPITQAGRYVLEVDPVVEKLVWFDNAGDARTTTTLIIESH